MSRNAAANPFAPEDRAAAPPLRDPAALPRLGWTLAALTVLWPLLQLARFDPAALFESGNLAAMGHFVGGFLPAETSPEFLALLGKATVENLTGSPEQALATIALQRALVPPLPNSASCTAEAYLLLGDAERALVDFATASAAHPTRVSAWLGLGQAQHLLGASPRPALDRVRQLVPVFFQQWQQETAGLGEQERFAHAFRMLRGNRGSGLITWWTADGAFHGEQAVLSAR